MNYERDRSVTLIFRLCGPTGRMFGMAFDQAHSRGQVADVDAPVYLDAELHPCSGKGNILHPDRQEPIRKHGA
jgi:hypothetical protein